MTKLVQQCCKDYHVIPVSNRYSLLSFEVEQFHYRPDAYRLLPYLATKLI